MPALIPKAHSYIDIVLMRALGPFVLAASNNMQSKQKKQAARGEYPIH